MHFSKYPSTAEEQGMVGSRNFVFKLEVDGINIELALIMDMIAFNSVYQKYSGNKKWEVTVETDEEYLPLAALFEKLAMDYLPELKIYPNFEPCLSDHVSFLKQ